VSKMEDTTGEIIILNQSSKYVKQHHKDKDLFKSNKIKAKRIFNYVIYLISIIIFMILPVVIVMLITNFGG